MVACKRRRLDDVLWGERENGTETETTIDAGSLAWSPRIPVQLDLEPSKWI